MFLGYDMSLQFYDEMFEQNGSIRPHYKAVQRCFGNMPLNVLQKRQQAIYDQMVKQGITFTLYGNTDKESLERTIPFDAIPRIIPSSEWEIISAGVKQRTTAINRFLWDVYHEQHIFMDGIIPRSSIISNVYFRPEMMHVNVPGGTYITLSGIDIIRDESGTYFVLEDNLRTPSGISYLYQNRALMRKLFPSLFEQYRVQSLSKGLNQFLIYLRSLAPGGNQNPNVVLLTPGQHNSAYFEHTFLAQELGIDLVEGQDLKVIDHKVYEKTIHGLRQVDVIYRRLDDEFLDPVCFRPDSLLGVPGIMNAYRAGNIAIANAPGTGIADDKAIYRFVPDIIRYYLNEEPILPNVPTYLLEEKEQRDYVLEHLAEMVVKETSLSGGYGMLIGPHANEETLNIFRQKIEKNPSRYIAQPTISLSRMPCFQEETIFPCHIDLRPYVMMGAGEDIYVVPGGLTRVALQKGSLVVNSSQGGGSKDTWIL